MPTAKFLIPALCLASALSAAAQTTYTAFDNGGADGLWATGANWNPDAGAGGPGALDTVTLGATPTGGTITMPAGTTTITRLGLSGTPALSLIGDGGGTSVLNLSNGAGNALTTTATGVTLDRLTLGITASSSAFTMNNSYTLSNGAKVSVGSGVSGFYSLSTGSRTVSSASSGVFENLGTLTVQGSSTRTLGFGSAVSLQSSGTLILGAANALSTVTANGTGASKSLLSGAMEFNHLTTPATFRNAGDLDVTGALSVGGTGVAGSVVDNTGSWNLNSGAGALALLSGRTLSNSGTLTLTTGTMSVAPGASITQSAGTLNFAGSDLSLGGTLTVNGGSVVGNTAAVSGAGASTLGASAATTLSPGASALATGAIAFPGALTLGASSTLAIDLNSDASFDTVAAGGAITLNGGTLSVSRNGTITPNAVFTIMSGGAAASGAFSSMSIVDGAWTYNVALVGNDVQLTAVPEPQFYAGAVGVGLLGFAAWRRAQKRA